MMFSAGTLPGGPRWGWLRCSFGNPCQLGRGTPFPLTGLGLPPTTVAPVLIDFHWVDISGQNPFSAITFWIRAFECQK